MCVCNCVLYSKEATTTAQIPPHLVAAVGAEHLKTQEEISIDLKSQEDHRATNYFSIIVFDFYIY